MSRIVDVSSTRVGARLHTPFVTALRRSETVDTVLVRVRDDDGHVGYGEAPQVWQVTGESLASATACLEQMLAPLVTGTDPDDWCATAARLPRAVARNAGAKAALDVALHDLAAQRADVTLADLLRTSYGAPSAGPAPRTVATDVTLSAGDADALAAAAVARVEDGFTTLKLKVGTDAATDVARVRAVRDAVGSRVTLRLDANQGWTREEAVDVVRALEAADLGVELVEQPVPGEDVEGLAWVRARVGLPVMADEALFTAYDLERILRLGAADAVNVKLAKTGSLGTAAALLRRAGEEDLGTMVGSMMETHVGLGAASALVAAVPTSGTNDLDAAWWAAATPYDGGITYSGGTITLSTDPGLGIRGLREDPAVLPHR